MEEYKSVAKFRKKHGQGKGLIKETQIKVFLTSFLSRLLIVILLFTLALIGCKNPKVKAFINEQVYHTNFKFASIKQLYQKYLGNIMPFKDTIPNTKPVFSEKLEYKSVNVYKDGVIMKVGSNYLVPVIESGIVVFIGDKEGYGKVIVVQQVNGIDLWYGNINISDIKLYDYIEKGSLIGESKDENIYLVFQKEGKFLNYKDYLK
ncbi:MAG: M23 family metallopeptidase [Bacilli bacterium]